MIKPQLILIQNRQFFHCFFQSFWIFETEQVELNHIYIDGSKFEANANKYSWVWKKATEKSRHHLFEKVTALLDEINQTLAFSGVKLQTNT